MNEEKQDKIKKELKTFKPDSQIAENIVKYIINKV